MVMAAEVGPDHVLNEEDMRKRWANGRWLFSENVGWSGF
jgi:hypothetical protein